MKSFAFAFAFLVVIPEGNLLFVCIATKPYPGNLGRSLWWPEKQIPSGNNNKKSKNSFLPGRGSGRGSHGYSIA